MKEKSILSVSISILILAIISMTVADNNQSPLYPKAYGIIGKGKYMFPVNMGDAPVKIDSKHQLFVDDFLIKSMTNIEREYHKLERHSDNPLWSSEQNMEQPFFVMRNEKGLFRLWYRQRIRFIDKEGNQRRFPTAYIESQDGLHWQAPNLGVIEADGNTENNYVFEKGLYGIIYEPWETNPNRRFKGLALFEPFSDENQKEPVEGYWLYVSPDGIRWNREREHPVLTSSLRKYDPPLEGIGDTSTFRWDPILNKYIANTKLLIKDDEAFQNKYRAFGIAESDDLIHWTQPRILFYRDELDPEDMQIYSHETFHYESMWFGIIKTMIIIEFQYERFWKHCELQLSLSRDGRNFLRSENRTLFLPTPENTDAWDLDYPSTAPGSPIRIGNELWFYYTDHRHWSRDSDGPFPEADSMHLGLATLRVDGFASLNAGDSVGTVVTRPLTFEGNSLFINAEIENGGYIQAEFRTVWGQQVGSYSSEKCQKITGNVYKAQIVWEDTGSIELPVNESFRLVFELKNAKLYSFWIE